MKCRIKYRYLYEPVGMIDSFLINEKGVHYEVVYLRDSCCGLMF